MNVWKKILTAIKGGANEAAEAIADSQAVRILEQELREARSELDASEKSVTTIIAKRKVAEDKVASIKASIAEYEQHALAAHEKGDSGLALECAGKVSQLKTEQEAEEEYVRQFSASEKTLRENIAKAKDNLRRMEQQLDTVKATESVQKAQAAVSSRHTGATGKLKTAADSLERIRQRQREQQAELEAAEELAAAESGDALDQRLKAAGIKGEASTADSELARILGNK